MNPAHPKVNPSHRRGTLVGRDLSYDQTVLMLGVLAASADGQRSADEANVIAARLAPHLGRLGPEGQATALRLLQDLLQTVGMERTLLTLGSHLPFPQDRAEAVRLAVSVAFADGRITPKEAEHVAWLADLLGLDEAQLRRVLGKPAGKGTAGKGKPQAK